MKKIALTLAVGLVPFAYAVSAGAATSDDAGATGCNTTDPQCVSYDPCTYDYPLPGYDCGSQTNNATRNGTFITPAADLGFTWNAPEAWMLDSLTQIAWDCGIDYDVANLPDYPAGCTPVLQFGSRRPAEFLEQMPGFNGASASQPDPREEWSYTFAWWLEGRADVTADLLAEAMPSYYYGLDSWCLVSVSPDVFTPGCSASDYTASFVQDGEGPGGERTFTGKVHLFDNFLTMGPISLSFAVRTHYCAKARHQVVLLSASPQPLPWEEGSTPQSEAVWARLLERQDAFDCE
jgi:hypothetical protein